MSRNTSMVAKPDIQYPQKSPLPTNSGSSGAPPGSHSTWPAAANLPAPSIQVALIAPIRGQMTVDELRAAHIQGAQDVLTSALLSLEDAPRVRRKEPASG